MLVINFLKIISWFLRTFTKNSATALPGLLLETYFPWVLKKIFSRFEKVVLITGTNGKTTTTQMICHLLSKNNIDFITNKSGSNLIRGIASSILDKTNFWGQPISKFGVFELEEGSIRKIVKFIKPQVIVITNIFRDQLDAYGEIDKTFRYIKEAVEKSDNPTLVLNGNDYRVSKLKQYTNNTVIELKLDEKYLDQIKVENNPYPDEENFIHKKQENYTLKNIQVFDDLSTIFDIEGLKSNFYKNKVFVPGMYNAINAASSILTVKKIVEEKSINLDLSDFPPAFGRGEIISIDEGKEFQFLLAKNPAGMNLNLHLLKNVKNREAVLIILNDNIADGKDISWIWDVDFHLLKELNFNKIYVSGNRKWDIALRLKYEGLNIHKECVFEDSKSAFEKLRESDHKKIYILPTYTAMLEFRKELGKFTNVKKMWK